LRDYPRFGGQPRHQSSLVGRKTLGPPRRKSAHDEPDVDSASTQSGHTGAADATDKRKNHPATCD
jgi:hypothetical protein